MKHRSFQKLTALILTVTAGMLCLTPAALAAEPNTSKEEVVYVSLDGTGAVEQINVVNIFDLAQAGEIVDYGDYVSVRNMTTTDELTYADGRVSASVGAGKLYYEGRLAEDVMPWTVAIHYYLDGAELTAEELAGKSGEMLITLTVEKNDACPGDFFENYALQVSLTLDTDRCEDITAADATVANVGGDKQLTYTVLPGRGLDTQITARVTDFEMEGISLNGVAMNLSVEVDDGELMDQVRELIDAVAALDDGAAALAEGTAELSGGAEELSAGAATVQSGAANLAQGARDLSAGAATVKSGLSSLSGQSASLNAGASQILTGLQALQSQLAGTGLSGGDVSALTAASAQIRAGVDQLASGLASLRQSIPDMSELAAANNATAASLRNAAAAAADEGTQALLNDAAAVLQQDALVLSALPSLTAAVDQLSAGAAELQTNCAAFDTAVQALSVTLADPAAVIAQLKGAVDALAAGAQTLSAGVSAYTAGADQLNASFGAITSGAASLASGGDTLSAGAGKLGTGAADLADGIVLADTGAADLADGTAAMRERTDGIDGRIQDKIDELLASFSGGTGETVSFVSADNVNIRSVQFVLRTAPIQVPAPAPQEEAEEPELNFWEKLTDLFR